MKVGIRKLLLVWAVIFTVLSIIFSVCFTTYGCRFFQHKNWYEFVSNNSSEKNVIKIAVIDSGFDFNHYDFGTNIKSGVNFQENRKEAQDENGHGTHVTGIIAASNNSIGIKGINPSALVYPLKVFDDEGKTNIEMILEAVKWSVDNNMDIINMSFSVDDDDSRLCEILKIASSKNIILIAAAYPKLDGTIAYPACYENVISVNAIDKNQEELFPFISNIVDLNAPGIDILTTDIGNSYVNVSGTSYASAYVTGQVSLILSEHSNWVGEKEKIVREIKKNMSNQN